MTSYALQTPRETASRTTSNRKAGQFNDLDKIQTFANILEAVLFTGKISHVEKQLLDDYREKHEISPSEFQQALTMIGFDPDSYLEAVVKGEEDLPDKKYGRCKYKTKFYTHSYQRKTVIAKGVIVAPHLRQWYERKDGKSVAFVRDHSERSATWLELFFDLIFVTVINTLSSLLVANPSNLIPFILLYTSFWRIWMGINLYSTRYERPDAVHPLVYLCTMVGVVAMGIQLENAFAGSADGRRAFMAAFLFSTLPVLVMYIFAAITEYRRRDLVVLERRNYSNHALIMTGVIGLSLFPWIICMLINRGYLLGMALGLITAELCEVLVYYQCHKSAPLCVEHWGERLSLLVMVHLGESMFTIIANFPPGRVVAEYYWEPYVASMMGLFIAFSIRRIYFDVEDEYKEPHALRRNRICALLWTAFHWVLCISIVLLAVGMHIVHEAIVESIGLRSGSATSENVTANEGGGVETVELTNSTSESSTHTDFNFFIYPLAIIIVTISLLSFFSVSSEGKLLPHIQYWRLVVRLIVGGLIILVPFAAHFDAIGLYIFSGLLTAMWALLESIIGIDKHSLSADNYTSTRLDFFRRSPPETF